MNNEKSNTKNCFIFLKFWHLLNQFFYNALDYFINFLLTTSVSVLTCKVYIPLGQWLVLMATPVHRALYICLPISSKIKIGVPAFKPFNLNCVVTGLGAITTSTPFVNLNLITGEYLYVPFISTCFKYQSRYNGIVAVHYCCLLQLHYLLLYSLNHLHYVLL
jgi:hypothetical protein